MIPGLLGTLAGGFRPTGISACRLWLDASQITGLSDEDPISPWSDLSGQGNNASASGALRPIYDTGIVGTLPGVRFNGSSQYMQLGDFLNGVTEATALIVAKHSTSPPTTNGPMLGDFGTADYADHTPHSDGHFYDDFCSTERKDAGVTATPVNTPFIYAVSSKDGEWFNSINGVLQYETAVNTFGAGATPKIGMAYWVGTENYYYITGHIFELAVYGRALTYVELATLEIHFANKWGITIDQSPVNTVAPAISAAGWTVGQVASCDTGTWTNEPTTYTYQWYLEVSEATYNQITGATNSTLLLTAPMVGLKVQCRVAASNAFAGPTEAQSADSDQIL